MLEACKAALYVAINDKEVFQSAKKKGVHLPPSDKWVWYEDDFNENIEKILDRFFVKAELKVVTFEVESSDKKINKFIRVQNHCLWQ